MTPEFAARLSPAQQRAAAVTLLVAVVLIVLALLLAPILLLHRHYDRAIEDLSDRLERYRRVAAQAPELRRALEIMKEKDGRLFYLKNTAPNLAAAELADLVRGTIEANGGRISTSQNPGPRDDGNFKQMTVNVQFFATMPALSRILRALEAQVPYLVVDNLTIRPLNAFRGFKPAAGQEPENNVQLDVSALAYPEVSKPEPAPSGVK
ncbi:MAG: hypothetical protein IT521_16800 [Burkholderiales bacterium]|nr:hypothetical protein [Burkholderiales bacterium]